MKKTGKMSNTVQVRRDGVAKSDGRPLNMNPTPRAPGHNVTMSSGRHATGQPLARVGRHAAQGPHTSGMTPGTGHNPKTGVSKSSPSRTMVPRPPVLTDAGQSSAQAQRMIKRPPMPFENPYGARNAPAPTNQNFQRMQTASQPAKNLHGGSSRNAHNITDCSILKGTSLTASELAAIGYSSADLQRAHGTRERDSIRGVRNNERKTGMPGTVNKGASAKDSQRMRQTGY